MASVTKSDFSSSSVRSEAGVMRAIYDNVSVCRVSDDGLQPAQNTLKSGIRVEISGIGGQGTIKLSKGSPIGEPFDFNGDSDTVRVGGKAIIISSVESSYMFCFSSIKDMKSFETITKQVISPVEKSVFTQRTEESSAEQYFQFYGYLSQQQNMMQDYIRTATYQRAMLDNAVDFQNKVVLDVGAGSGILSFFAVQAGARKVYAIEASSMAQQCQTLVANNGLEDKIIVIAGKIEEVDVPEQVDVIISEPMGYMLFNERMLETFLHAKKWLKPTGKMYPTQGDLHIAPFTDEALYMEQCSKANFWYQPSFHSVDLTSLREAAIQEYFRQPIVDTFDIRICLARSHKYTVDFLTAHETDLYSINIPVSYVVAQEGTIHGLAFWFDVAFLGSQSSVWLSTAPTQPLTHWYQVRCLLETPMYVKQGQQVVGRVLLKCNKRQSYDVDISLNVPGTTIKSSNILDLKNPLFRYTGQPPQPPPNTVVGVGQADGGWNSNDITMQVVNADNISTGGSGVALNPDSFNIAMLNGSMDDQQMLQQIAVVGDTPSNGNITAMLCDNNLASLGTIAPINPGSIPSPAISSINPSRRILNSHSSATADGSPIILLQTPSAGSEERGLIGGHYLLGDYLVPSAASVLPVSAESLRVIN